MHSMEDIYIGAVVGLIIAVIGVLLWKLGYESGYHSAYGSKGNAAKTDRKTQVNLAMLRIKELHDAKTPPLDIGKTIVIEYPEVAWQALREAKKLSKELGMEDLA